MRRHALRFKCDRSIVPLTLMLMLALWTAACAGDAGKTDEPTAGDEPVAGDDLGDSSATSDDSYGDEPQPSQGVDPEMALAAIPQEMLPATMLDELKTRLLVPDVERGGRTYFTDIVTIEAGADVTFCTYLPGVTEGVTHIHDTLGRQTRYGHHAILQYLTTPQQPGTRACPEASELDAQLGQILGGTGGEGNGAIVLPANVVSEVPAGAQLVINHHWINVGNETIQAQGQMITVPPASEHDLVIARAMAIAVTDFKVAPGEAGEASGECTFDAETRLLSMIGHEHQWGTHVRAERLAPAERMIFDHDYDPDMISRPLTSDFPLQDPFVFAPGDTVRMTCQWQNTSEAALVFPREMCILFGWQIGAAHDTTCYNGAWL